MGGPLLSISLRHASLPPRFVHDFDRPDRLGSGQRQPVLRVRRRPRRSARRPSRVDGRTSLSPARPPGAVAPLRMEIAYAEARITSLRRLQREYDRVNRFGTGNALTLSAEQVRLELMREDMVLRDLREQLILEQRYGRDSRRTTPPKRPKPCSGSRPMSRLNPRKASRRSRSSITEDREPPRRQRVAKGKFRRTTGFTG